MAVKDVRYRSMICDICGAEEQLEPSVPNPEGWWALRFAKNGLTTHSFDLCPECFKAIYMDSGNRCICENSQWFLKTVAKDNYCGCFQSKFVTVSGKS